MRASVFLILLLTSEAAKADDLPSYEAYPATVFNSATHHAPIFQTKEAYDFRTRLRAASALPANFDGHYRLQTWGCGMGCTFGGIVDLISGATYILPFGVTGDHTNKEGNYVRVEFKNESSLVVFHGQIDQQGVDGDHYYFFDGSFLRPIRTVAYRQEPPTQPAISSGSQVSDATRKRIHKEIVEYAQSKGETEEQFGERLGTSSSKLESLIYGLEEGGSTANEALKSFENFTVALKNPDKRALLQCDGVKLTNDPAESRPTDEQCYIVKKRLGVE